MKVIGLVGPIGSGKDTVSNYISKKYDYKVVGMGDIVREIAAELGRGHTRDELHLTQKEIVAKYGTQYFAERVVEKIKKNGWQKVIINGIRRPEDAAVPKREFGKDIVIAWVDALPEIRFERMKTRKRPGDPHTMEEFLRQEENEKRFFHWDETRKYVDDVIINNDGTYEELHKNVGAFMKKFNLA